MGGGFISQVNGLARQMVSLLSLIYPGNDIRMEAPQYMLGNNFSMNTGSGWWRNA
jgi:hypothetical protein